MSEPRFTEIDRETVLDLYGSKYPYAYRLHRNTPKTDQFDPFYHVVEWSIKQFGKNNGWCYDFPVIFFQNQNDAFEFKLRWV